MTQQTINVGAAPNDGTGDPARTAFTKSNDNFTELYARGSLTAPQGRLTLQTLTPVMTTTQSTKTTIFYTPYAGNKVPIYDGTNMAMTTFAELSVATTDTTKNPAAIGASKVNDWFVWSDSGALRLSHGPDWTSDTARSAGTALVMVGGILLNNAAITNGPAASRGTYVGTTRSNASSQLDWQLTGAAATGQPLLLSVWNAYNRVDVAARTQDTADHSISTVAIWGTGATANTKITFVSGLAEDVLRAEYLTAHFSHTGTYACLGVAYDAATDPSGILAYAPAGMAGHMIAKFETTAVGAHTVKATELSGASSGAFFMGTGGVPAGAMGAVGSGLTLNFRM